MAEVSVHKPRVLVDFDGTLCEYVSAGGWQGFGHIAGGPKPGALEWLASLLPHFDVVIFTTRAEQVGGVLAVQNWFKFHWPNSLPPCIDENKQLLFKVTNEKMAARVLIDDRAMRFAGEWPSPIDLLNYFAYDEPVAAAEPDNVEHFRVRCGHLYDAVNSYQSLATEMEERGRGRWAAQLRHIAQQARALAGEIDLALPPS